MKGIRFWCSGFWVWVEVLVWVKVLAWVEVLVRVNTIPRSFLGFGPTITAVRFELDEGTTGGLSRGRNLA